MTASPLKRSAMCPDLGRTDVRVDHRHPHSPELKVTDEAATASTVNTSTNNIAATSSSSSPPVRCDATPDSIQVSSRSSAPPLEPAVFPATSDSIVVVASAMTRSNSTSDNTITDPNMKEDTSERTPPPSLPPPTQSSPSYENRVFSNITGDASPREWPQLHEVEMEISKEHSKVVSLLESLSAHILRLTHLNRKSISAAHKHHMPLVSSAIDTSKGYCRPCGDDQSATNGFYSRTPEDQPVASAHNNSSHKMQDLLSLSSSYQKDMLSLLSTSSQRDIQLQPHRPAAQNSPLSNGHSKKEGPHNGNHEGGHGSSSSRDCVFAESKGDPRYLPPPYPLRRWDSLTRKHYPHASIRDSFSSSTAAAASTTTTTTTTTTTSNSDGNPRLFPLQISTQSNGTTTHSFPLSAPPMDGSGRMTLPPPISSAASFSDGHRRDLFPSTPPATSAGAAKPNYHYQYYTRPVYRERSASSSSTSNYPNDRYLGNHKYGRTFPEDCKHHNNTSQREDSSVILPPMRRYSESVAGPTNSTTTSAANNTSQEANKNSNGNDGPGENYGQGLQRHFHRYPHQAPPPPPATTTIIANTNNNNSNNGSSSSSNNNGTYTGICGNSSSSGSSSCRAAATFGSMKMIGPTKGTFYVTGSRSRSQANKMPYHQSSLSNITSGNGSMVGTHNNGHTGLANANTNGSSPSTATPATGNQPIPTKRPLSDFNFFCRDARKLIVEESPSYTKEEVNRELGRAWAQLDKETRMYYRDLYVRDKSRYQKQQQKKEGAKNSSSNSSEDGAQMGPGNNTKKGQEIDSSTDAASGVGGGDSLMVQNIVKVIDPAPMHIQNSIRTVLRQLGASNNLVHNSNGDRNSPNSSNGSSYTNGNSNGSNAAAASSRYHQTSTDQTMMMGRSPHVEYGYKRKYSQAEAAWGLKSGNYVATAASSSANRQSHHYRYEHQSHHYNHPQQEPARPLGHSVGPDHHSHTSSHRNGAVSARPGDEYSTGPSSCANDKGYETRNGGAAYNSNKYHKSQNSELSEFKRYLA
ncbi:hypothetical protein H4219_004196 [Mycoemilia scoparia]|uniref:HMG box domain-containing protein n=1 Tax=Mycoemilia scoparia TaxID=417184 RepID=A0A9W8DRS4_9FUNG|nr:hypothetical protein H4219_004196 [Mycoemilia scoparia]